MVYLTLQTVLCYLTSTQRKSRWEGGALSHRIPDAHTAAGSLQLYGKSARTRDWQLDQLLWSCNPCQPDYVKKYLELR